MSRVKIRVVDIAQYDLFTRPHVEDSQGIEVSLPLGLTTPVSDFMPCLSINDDNVRELLSSAGQVFQALYSYKREQLIVSYENRVYDVHVLVNSDYTTISIGNSSLCIMTHSSFIEDRHIDYYVDMVDGKITLYYEYDELIGIIEGPERTNNVLLMTVIGMSNSNVYIKCDRLRHYDIRLRTIGSVSGGESECIHLST